MEKFPDEPTPELFRATHQEIFNLYTRGEISRDRLELESDWIDIQDATERHDQKKAARREKVASVFGRISLRRK